MGFAYTKRQKKKLDSGYSTRKSATDDKFKKFIRYRDMFFYMKKHGLILINGYPSVSCCTCGAVFPGINNAFTGNNCHAGHYVQCDRITTRFHEKNLNVQCLHCNSFQSGMQSLHGKYIDRLYGKGTSDMLDNLGELSRRGAKMGIETLLLIEETAERNTKQIVKAFVSMGVDPSIFK